MVKCNPGDQVICRLRDHIIVSVYDDKWDNEEIFDIICLYDEGYLIYVSLDSILKDCIYITANNYKKFAADKKFIDSYVYYITDHKIVRMHKKIDGMCCIKCQTFYGMAAPNQSDGTLICWSCSRWPHYD